MKISQLAFCALSTALVYGGPDAPQRLDAAADVITEIMATPDKGIPQDMLANAHCIIIVPGLKRAGFVVGGEYGKGVFVRSNV